MAENNVPFIKLLQDYSNQPNKIHDTIDRNPSLFVSKFHKILATENNHDDHRVDADKSEDSLMLVLSVLQQLLEKTSSLKREFNKSSNKYVIIDLIYCAKYNTLHTYIINVFNTLAHGDILTRAVIETELYAATLGDALSEEANENIRKLLEQFSHRSKPVTPKKTPTNIDTTNDFWIGCINDVSLQLTTAIENLHYVNAVLPGSYSPRSFHVSFVSPDVVSTIISAKDSDEMIEALDEMMGVYKAFMISHRASLKDDAASIIRHIVYCIASNNSMWHVTEVIIRGLLFMECLSCEHAELFIPESGRLFHQLEDFIADIRPSVRILALKLAKSLVLRQSCLNTTELVRDIFSRQLSAESSIVGTCYLINLLSSRIISCKRPNMRVGRVEDSLSESSTITICLRLVLQKSYDLVMIMLEQDPLAAEAGLDTLSIGLLLSLPSSYEQSSYDRILQYVKELSSLSPYPTFLPTNIPTSSLIISQEITRRAKQWSFTSLQLDQDVRFILRKHHPLLYSFLNRPIPSPYPSSSHRQPIASTSPDIITPAMMVPNNTSTGISEPVYLPSWSSKDISLSDSIASSSIQTTASEINNDSPRSSTRTSLDYDSLTATPMRQTSNSPPDQATSELDQSKLTSLKRNTTSRRLSTRRAHTASETILYAADDQHEVDSDNMRIPPATSTGIRSSRDHELSPDAIDIKESNTTTSSSRRSSRAGQMLRRRQLLSTPGITSSPYESENESTIGHDLVTKSFQDNEMFIAQARQALEGSVAGMSLLHPAGLNNDDMKVLKSQSLTTTPDRSAGRRLQQRSRLSTHQDTSSDQSTSGSGRNSRAQSASQEFEEVDTSYLASNNGHSKNSSSSVSIVTSSEGNRSPDVDAAARHPPRSIPKNTSRNPRRSISSESVNGIMLDGIASIEVASSDLSPPPNSTAAVAMADTISPPASSAMDSAMKANVEYLDSSQIYPIDHPSAQLTSILKIFESESDWEKLFYTLNTMRSLVLHHQSTILSSGKLHTIVIGIMKQIDNLRSAVAKNAILTLGDMYQGLGRSMESEAASTIPTLIKRFGLSSSFLSESAELALQKMCRNVSSTCAMSALLLGIDNKTASIRGKVMSLISGLIELKGKELIGTKDLEILKGKLSKLYSDSSPEARAHCRHVARLLIANDMVSISELEAIMTVDAVAKSLKEGMLASASVSRSNSISLSSTGSSTGSRSSVGDMSKSSSRKSSINQDRLRQYSRQSSITSDISASDRGTPDSLSDLNIIGSRASSSTKKLFDIADNDAISVASDSAGKVTGEEVDAMLGALISATSWNERKDAIDKITLELMKSSAAVRHIRKLDACVEAMVDKLQDGNIKVVGHVLTCLQRLLSSDKKILSTSSSILIPALVTSSCAANKAVANQAGSVLSEYLATIPDSQAIQQLSIVSLHEKDRVRAQAFRLLAENMTSYCQPDPTSTPAIPTPVRDILFPAVCQTLNASIKPEVSQGVSEVMRALHKEAFPRGEKIWQWIDDKKQQDIVKKMLGTV